MSAADDPKSIRVGVDLDNTIVCYDALVCSLAAMRGLVAPAECKDRIEVRELLRRTGREEDWTHLQGEIYGGLMRQAVPFPGVESFFRACVERGATAFIVSHRSRHPYVGPKSDLHAVAWQWLEQQRWIGPNGTGLLPRENVFLEVTESAKLARLTALNCTHFVDDLPEFLAAPGFPDSIWRVLFDPNRRCLRRALAFPCASTWGEIQSYVLGSQAA